MRIVNNNRIYKDDQGFWRVESANGEWDGYELYDTELEAECAALRPNDEDEEWEE